MIYLHYTPDLDKKVWSLDSSFDYYCKRAWFEHPLVKYIIESVEGNVFVGPTAYDSPVLNLIGPNDISGGAKCLIWMLNEPDMIFPLRYLDDNAMDALEVISKEVDCHLQFQRYFPEFTETMQFVTPGGKHCTGFTELKVIGSEEGWW